MIIRFGGVPIPRSMSKTKFLRGLYGVIVFVVCTAAVNGAIFGLLKGCEAAAS